jgi:hypothetical protein
VVWVLGFGACGLGLRVWGLRFGIFGFGVWDLQLTVSGSGFSSFGVTVWLSSVLGLGFRVEG